MIKLTLIILLLFNFLFTSSPASDQNIDSIENIDPLINSNDDDLEKFAINKVIPEEIKNITLEALSYYPELMEVDIDFQFQKKIRGSVMQAQPKIGSLIFNNKENRAYRIKISRYLELYDELLPIEELPAEVLLGWLGHELGHIKDYIDRSAANLISFGVKYYLSKSFMTKAEVQADSYTVSNGLANEIIATKNFVLNHEKLPEKYKNKIKALYMSPGEILSLVDVEDGDEEN
ncbi:MAG: hypothetical protein WD426_18725 [Anditalea sp.]